MRALFQRKKGRDLFDLCWALSVRSALPVSVTEILHAFDHYMKAEGELASRQRNRPRRLTAMWSVAVIAQEILVRQLWARPGRWARSTMRICRPSGTEKAEPAPPADSGRYRIKNARQLADVHRLHYHAWSNRDEQRRIAQCVNRKMLQN